MKTNGGMVAALTMLAVLGTGSGNYRDPKPEPEKPAPWINNPSLNLPKSVRRGKSVSEILAIKKAMWEERNGKLDT